MNIRARTITALAVWIGLTMIVHPLSAAEWEDVSANKAMFALPFGERTVLQQQSSLKNIIEYSKWVIADGGEGQFWTAYLRGRLIFVERGERLADYIRELFPNASLGAESSKSLNDLGQHDWQRFTVKGIECVFMRQYRWDDDAQINGTHIPLGKARVLGYYCPAKPLSNQELEALFDTLQIWG